MYDNLILKIEKLVTDEKFKKLRDVYDRTTIFDILGISRDENRHSRFLEWLFNPKETHKLNDEPLKYLFRFLLREYYPEKINFSEKIKNDVILNKSKTSILVVDSQVEKNISTNNKNRVDIFIEGNIYCNDVGNNQNFILIIENKIDSIESKNQTLGYEHDLLDYPSVKSGESIPIMIYLTIDKSKKPTSDKFINITYQELVDNVIYPLFVSSKNQITKHYLNAYLNTLEKSLISEKIGGKLVMAIRPDTKSLLIELYKEHKEIFDSIFKENYSLIEDDSLKNNFDKMNEQEITRDNTRYNFLGVENIPKNRLVYMIVKQILVDNPNYSVYDLREVFKDIRKSKFIETDYEDSDRDKENGITRFFSNEEDIMEDKNGVKFTVSNQWGMDDNFRMIIKIAKSLGYDIEAITPSH